MGVELSQTRVESGYRHDETDRWIDCSYTRYDVRITGAAALEKLIRGFETLHANLHDLHSDHERRLIEAEGLARADYERRLGDYQAAMEARLRMSWWKALLTPRPACPEYAPPDRSGLDEIEDALSQLTLTANLARSLDAEFGEYVETSRRSCPFEYNLMVLRHFPPAEMCQAVQQLARRRRTRDDLPTNNSLLKDTQ